MIYDENVPRELKKTQEWFASIITRPIDFDNQMMKTSPSGKAMTEEAKEFIVPSHSLEPEKRIQIYNQQYWWRLLSILHENFPMTVRLFGFRQFNEMIGFPYLVAYPPSHWSLNFIGINLSKWVQECYFEEDKQLIHDAVAVDYAYSCSFFAKKNEPLDFAKESENDLSELKLTLQPYVHLFKLDCDLFKFRSEIVKEEPDYWLEHDFPDLERGEFYFILFRNMHNFAVSDRISPVAYHILKHFEKGASIDDVCEWIGRQDETTCAEAMQSMQQWFRDWAILQLLVKSC